MLQTIRLPTTLSNHGARIFAGVARWIYTPSSPFAATVLARIDLNRTYGVAASTRDPAEGWRNQRVCVHQIRRSGHIADSAAVCEEGE
jgi:hypothetical protein